jgi:hypothetical protein
MKEKLKEMQRQHKAWVEHNFPNRDVFHTLAQLAEEIGEGAQEMLTVLPADECVLTPGQSKELSDVVITCADLCTKLGWDLADIYERVLYVDGYIDHTALPASIALGRIARGVLKHWQGIRTDEQHLDDAKHALRVLLFSVDMHFRTRRESLLEHVLARWETVRQRDWVAHPKTGRPE